VNVPIEGITLSPGAVVFPVGHRATVRVAFAHERPRAGVLPEGLPAAMQVARGWTTVVDHAGRVVLPDTALIEDIAHLRSELALNGPIDPAEDVVGFLIDVGHLVRLGEKSGPWVADIADAVHRVARLPHSWDSAAALDGAAGALAAAGEKRAVTDIARLRSPATAELPPAPAPERALAWREQRLARSRGDGTAELLAGGVPAPWLGANFEVYGLPIGPATTISYAMRWHGERPAVLWETEGPTVPLTAPSAAPGWSTAEPAGEALWPAPVGATSSAPASGADISFS
jgi:hypothetical protein